MYIYIYFSCGSNFIVCMHLSFFLCCRTFWSAVEHYCCKYWSSKVLDSFFGPLRGNYRLVIEGRKGNKSKIADLTVEGTRASVIETVRRKCGFEVNHINIAFFM